MQIETMAEGKAVVHKVGGYSGGDTQHSYSEEEKVAFVDWITDCLGKDADLKEKFPMSSTDDSLFKACTDGILLWYVFSLPIPLISFRPFLQPVPSFTSILI